jgi:hypothetical protein
LKAKVQVGEAIVAFELTNSKKELVCKPQHNTTRQTKLLQSGGTFCRTWEEIGSS